MQSGTTIIAGSLQRVAAVANKRVPANVHHCNSSPESSLTLPLHWHLFSFTSPVPTSQALNIFKGPASLAFRSLRTFINICCISPWQLSLKFWSLVVDRWRIVFLITWRHCLFWLLIRSRTCSLYSKKLRRKKLHAAKSALPTTPATASVCMGWAAKLNPATAVPTFIQWGGNNRRAVVTTSAVAIEWNRILKKW